MPLRAHEMILIFYHRLPKYHPQKTEGKPHPAHGRRPYSNYGKVKDPISRGSADGSRYPRDVIRFSNTKIKGMHPTSKPIPLLEYIIRTYTDEGDVVLDPFMGSGSCGVACRNTGRRFIGIEKDEAWFRYAVERLAAVRKEEI